MKQEIVTLYKISMMKSKLFMLALGVFSFTIAKANATDPGRGKKDELNGVVVHSDTKKPLKEVSITAYRVSKKEKVTITDNEGGYAFDDLKPGVYKFVFEKAGFKKITKEKVVIKTDEAFQMNIEMIEHDDYDIMPSPFHMNPGIR